MSIKASSASSSASAARTAWSTVCGISVAGGPPTIRLRLMSI